MTSFADLFNPSFLIFLGIILLVTAILFLYFENKLREQNHKIASMLSLVSSLAEEVNGVKLGLNHLSIMMIGGGQDNHFSNQPNFQPFNHLEEKFNTSIEQNNLIVVSDDEDSDNEDNDNEDEDEEYEDGDDEDETNDSDSESSNSNEIEELNDTEENNYISNDIKILKLNLNIDSNKDEAEETQEIEELNDENDDDNVVDFISLNNYENNYNNEEQQYDISSELKTINVNLEERKNIDLIENIDYKKLPLNKLRTVVAEKGLIVDPSKLKKFEMLKLLGAE